MNPGTDFSIFAMKFLGYNLNNNMWVNAIPIIFYEIIFFVMLILSLLEIIINSKTVIQVTDAFKIVPHCFSGMCKIGIYYLYMTEIRDLLKYEGFRPMNYCGSKLEKRQMKIYTIIMRFIKFIGFVGGASIAVCFLMPLLKKERGFPLKLYEFIDFTQSPIYEIICIWQFLGSCVLNVLVLGYDCFLLSLFMFAYNQTLMLKHDIRKLSSQKIITNMDEQKMFNELKENIIFHNRILWFVKNVNRIYSFPLLSQLVISLSIFCLELYVSAGEKNIDLAAKATSMETIGNYGINLYIVCLCSTMVTSQLESIQTVIYDSEWYLSPIKSPRIAKCLLLMIQMSQRQIVIKAGGLFKLDMDTFTAVLRLSYSYYTVMLALS